MVDKPADGSVTETEVRLPKTRKGGSILTVEHQYVSQTLDVSIDDLNSYEAIRASEVEDTLAYFDSVRDPLTQQLKEAMLVMENRKQDPYVGLRLPEHVGAVSLSDLENLVGRMSNAYMTYAEYLSAARAILSVREGLYERRKGRAAINEGGNEQERKALAGMRAEPEFLSLVRVQMLNKWIETRYFAFKSMMEASQQLLTTKSVEAARAKQIDTES
jgi:hypothetical protein